MIGCVNPRVSESKKEIFFIFHCVIVGGTKYLKNRSDFANVIVSVITKKIKFEKHRRF